MGILGVVLLNNVWSRNFAWAGLSASLIFISSFVCEAAYSVIGKTIILRASVIKMLTISLLIGTGVNLLIDGRETFSLAQHLSANAWVLLILMAVICTAVGYTFWFVVLKECPVNVAALTIFAQSVFGVLIAAVWLKERLHWGQFWGSLVITVGLVLGLSRQIKTVETNAEVESESSAR
jgi:drug/metabolite transporter (DMT)-like permease